MSRLWRLSQAMRRELKIFRNNPQIAAVTSATDSRSYQDELHKLRLADPRLYRNFLDACDRALRQANSEE